MNLRTIVLVLVTMCSPVRGQWIEQVRLAGGDFNGDGVIDVVAGGRVGPYVSSDTPVESRRARVEILDGGVSIGPPLASTSDLNVVSDVAAGDLDGDGEPEIVVVGGGRLTVFRRRGATLQPVVVLHPGDVTQRVAVQGGPPRGLIATTGYVIGGDGDSGRTTIRLYSLGEDRLEVKGQIEVRGHIGDLTFFKMDETRAGLVAETGGGEEGGDAVAWNVSLPAQPVAVWEGRVNEGQRMLAVAPALHSPGSVAFGGINGRISVCEWTGGGFRVRDVVDVGPVVDFVAQSPARWLVSTGGGALRPVTMPR